MNSAYIYFLDTNSIDTNSMRFKENISACIPTPFLNGQMRQVSYSFISIMAQTF